MGGERVSSLRVPPFTRVKPSAKRDAIAAVNFIMVLDIEGMK